MNSPRIRFEVAVIWPGGFGDDRCVPGIGFRLVGCSSAILRRATPQIPHGCTAAWVTATGSAPMVAGWYMTTRTLPSSVRW